MKAVSVTQEINYMKQLAKAGREYLEQLEEDRKEFIRANNREQREPDTISAEKSPKKENDGDPE